jgi:hypothetical protein
MLTTAGAAFLTIGAKLAGAGESIDAKGSIGCCGPASAKEVKGRRARNRMVRLGRWRIIPPLTPFKSIIQLLKRG